MGKFSERGSGKKKWAGGSMGCADGRTTRLRLDVPGSRARLLSLFAPSLLTDRLSPAIRNDAGWDGYGVGGCTRCGWDRSSCMGGGMVRGGA